MSRRSPTQVVPHQGPAPSIWRSLEDRSRSSEERKKIAETEFDGGQTSDPSDILDGSFVPAASLERSAAVSRRGFIQLSTAAAAAASLSGCIRRPKEKIVPYGTAPEHTIPGVPQHFATVTERNGDALGLLVTTYEGRPTKVEGNPRHPRSVGATDVQAQALLMGLYDPDRSEFPTERVNGEHQKRSWDAFRKSFEERLKEHEQDGGAGLRFALPYSVSPSLARVTQKLIRRFPQARVYRHDAVPRTNLVDGVEAAFGTKAYPIPIYNRARTIVALDCDFLATEPGSVRSTQLFSKRRRPPGAELADGMNRLYVIEPTFSVTGATADHRLAMPAQNVGLYLCQMAAGLADLAEQLRALPPSDAVRRDYHLELDLAAIASAAKQVVDGASPAAVPPRWLFEMVDGRPTGLLAELLRKDRQGASLVVVGSRQPAAVHALAHALNQALGAVQRTMAFAPVAEEEPAAISLPALCEELQGGAVKTLVNLGINPVYDSPADARLTPELLAAAEAVYSVTSHLDETSQQANWHCPLTHEFEAWGDARAIDGSLAIQQPTLRPLWHGARSALEMVALAAGETNWRGFGVVRQTFRDSVGRSEQSWHSALHRGLAADGGSPASVALTLQQDRVTQALSSLGAQPALGKANLEVNFLPCSKLYDGRFANNIWLQELPDPMTKLVWDNAALVAPSTAKQLGLSDGDLVRLSRQDQAGDEHRIEEIAVMAMPGLPEWTFTLTLGHGRGEEAGRYAHGDEHHGGGFDVFPLRTSDAPWFVSGVTAAPLGRRYMLTRTQEHGLMSGLSHQEPRAIILESDVEGYKAQPDFAAYKAVDMNHHDPANPDSPQPGGPLWRPVDYSEGHKWGMTIDLSACTGCNACVVACQAENNVPAVGKRQVARGREMYWLRIDRYFVGDDLDNPQIAVQPVACQHCEEAPCENVCPVNATVHGPEGMNNMAYNRCIGTRYCANNCPYKVRRFNYLAWHGYVNDRFADYDGAPETQKMAHNPNVTVRYRGVMEKCSYCVQRVNAAKIEVKHRSATAVARGSLPRDEAALAAVRERLQRGQLQSACQQVCPADAIHFGDLNDRRSEVARLAASDRNYALLAELGTRPRTSFLAKIRNTNPDMHIEPPPSGHDHDHGHDHGAHSQVHPETTASHAEKEVRG